MSAYSNEYIWKTNKEEINMKRKNFVKKSTTISVCQPITQMIFHEYRRFRKKQLGKRGIHWSYLIVLDEPIYYPYFDGVLV
jgi:hypothetical protein